MAELDNFGIIGRSHGIQQMLLTIYQVAPTDISVLVFGESGTGKELVAKAIHEQSARKDKPLVVVNCGAIPEGILESELFGHEKGSFTGAIGARKGYFELADNGTVFLDEVGEMPLSTQVKLLRVLENGDFMRVGGTSLQQVNVRVIAATNKDLDRAVANGEFREDLYYRLNAVHIKIPPLRERREDIPLLIKKIESEFAKENRIEFGGFSETAMNILVNHTWRGNVRELKNAVESMIVLEKGRVIDEFTLSNYVKPLHSTDRNLPVPTNRSSDQVEREFIYRALIDLKSEISKLREDIYQTAYRPSGTPKSLPVYSEVYHEDGESVITDNLEEDVVALESMKLIDVERRMINQALESNNGSKRKAAKTLGISERTLYRKIKEYDLPF